jgi:Na+-driven multidrug efflux pump
MMNILSIIGKANAIGKYALLVVLALNLVSVVFASSGLTNALSSLCVMSQTFLGVTAMVLVVLAGTVYAIGQILGAETRARAAVWATAMLTGAVIGAIIYIVAPIIIKGLLGDTGAGSSIDSDNPCTV